MSMPHVVVAGAAGFIESHVCEALLAKGCRVTGIDCFDDFYDPSIKRGNLAACVGDGRFTLVEADIRDHQAMSDVMKQKPDAVIHLAACAGVRPSIERPLLYQEVNVGGTCVLLEAARHWGILSVVCSSELSMVPDLKLLPAATRSS